MENLFKSDTNLKKEEDKWDTKKITVHRNMSHFDEEFWIAILIWETHLKNISLNFHFYDFPIRPWNLLFFYANPIICPTLQLFFFCWQYFEFICFVRIGARKAGVHTLRFSL